MKTFYTTMFLMESLHLAHPDRSENEWIGQRNLASTAGMLVVHPKDMPLSPKLVGPPGGKTSLVWMQSRNRHFHLPMTSDTRPEDLLVTPVLSEAGKISYTLTSGQRRLLGVCILDEGNR